MPPLHVAKRPTPNSTFSCYRVLEGELVALVFLFKHHRLTDVGLLVSLPSPRVQIWSFISHVPHVLALLSFVCVSLSLCVIVAF